MDRGTRTRRDPRVGEIGEREKSGRSLGAQVAAAEPEDGQRAERDEGDLRECERERRRPDHPERREQGEEGIDVAAETNHLLAGCAMRDLERPAVGGAPDGLNHVAEIESPDAEAQVTVSHDRVKNSRPAEHRHPDRERPGVLPNEPSDVRVAARSSLLGVRK